MASHSKRVRTVIRKDQWKNEMNTTVQQTTLVCSARNKKGESRKRMGTLMVCRRASMAIHYLKKTNIVPVDQMQVGEEKCQQEYSEKL